MTMGRGVGDDTPSGHGALPRRARTSGLSIADASKQLLARAGKKGRLSRTEERVVSEVVQHNLPVYVERWKTRFSDFVTGLELVQEEVESPISYLLDNEDSTDRFNSNAAKISVQQVSKCVQKGHKMTRSYLSERISDGPKWAYQYELSFVGEERWSELLERMLGEEASKVRHYGHLMKLPAFWSQLRIDWSRGELGGGADRVELIEKVGLRHIAG